KGSCQGNMHRKPVLVLAVVAVACLLTAGNGVRLVSAFQTSDPVTEVPASKVDRQTYLRLRGEQVGRLRGFSSRAVPAELREAAIKQMEVREKQISRAVSLQP